MAWTQEAREAALEARRANAAGRQQAQPQRPARGVGVRHQSAGASAAFKMRHDMGKDERIRAYNAAHQQGIASRVPGWAAAVGKALLGAGVGLAGTVVREAVKSGMRGGHRGR